MATPAVGYAAPAAKAPLEPFSFERRAPHENDVAIKIAYCGVCHSDVHQARDEWGGSTFPMVPGHEIVGHVTSVGPRVTKFKIGDTVGVGCMVDSCMSCRECDRGLEQHCQNGSSSTYNSTEQDKKTPTYGGYSDHMVVREDFVLHIPANLDLCAAAPLLCAGITTYSPLKQCNVQQGTKVGVVGLGGLGHMAVKLARAMGAEVTVFTTSSKKIDDATALGAHHGVLSTDPAAMAAVAGTLNVIINTVGAKHDLAAYLGVLDIEGKMMLVGLPEGCAHPSFSIIGLIMGRRSIGGSLIGGIAETQEMLDFCGQHNIVSEVEKIPMNYINEAYERMMKSDVKYRFVIDMATLH